MLIVTDRFTFSFRITFFKVNRKILKSVLNDKFLTYQTSKSNFLYQEMNYDHLLVPTQKSGLTLCLLF
jgi:hypothetical protein